MAVMTRSCGRCVDGITRVDGEFCPFCQLGANKIAEADKAYQAQLAQQSAQTADSSPDPGYGSIEELATPDCTKCGNTGEADGVPCSCGANRSL